MPSIPLSIHKMRQTAETVGHWTFSEGTGNTLADASGNNNPGTRGTGAAEPQWVTTGRHLNALSFDGNDTVSIPHASSLNLTNVSVLAWVNPAANGSYPMFVSKFTSNTNRYELLMNAGTGKAEMLAGNAMSSAVEAVDPIALTLGTWYFLVGTFDGSNVKIYRDGALKTTAALAGNLDTNTAALALGSRNDATQYYQGRLDNVQIRNVAMTAEQIAAEFQRMTRVVLIN